METALIINIMLIRQIKFLSLVLLFWWTVHSLVIPYFIKIVNRSFIFENCPWVSLHKVDPKVQFVKPGQSYQCHLVAIVTFHWTCHFLSAHWCCVGCYTSQHLHSDFLIENSKHWKIKLAGKCWAITLLHGRKPNKNQINPDLCGSTPCCAERAVSLGKQLNPLLFFNFMLHCLVSSFHSPPVDWSQWNVELDVSNAPRRAQSKNSQVWSNTFQTVFLSVDCIFPDV